MLKIIHLSDIHVGADPLGKADLMLFGHKHWSQAFFDHKGIPAMLASGKVTKPNRRNNLAFRVVEIDNGKIYRVYTRRRSGRPRWPTASSRGAIQG